MARLRVKGKCLALGLLLFASTASAQAVSVSLGWDYPTVPPDFAGFRIYYDVMSRGAVVNPGEHDSAPSLEIAGSPQSFPKSTTLTLPDCDTTYFFSVTAFDANGNESDYSNEVSVDVSCPIVTVPPPKNLRFIE